MNQKNIERDLLQQEYDNNESQLEQLKHQQERLENRIAYYEKGERKKRTHRLCTIAGTLESIAPGIKELTLPEVIELLENIFSYPEVLMWNLWKHSFPKEIQPSIPRKRYWMPRLPR